MPAFENSSYFPRYDNPRLNLARLYMCAKKSPGHDALGFLTLFIIGRSTGSTRADEHGC